MLEKKQNPIDPRGESTACCRFRRCVLVRVRIEFANRSAASASEDRATSIDINERIQKSVEVPHDVYMLSRTKKR
jgi:hypothetical protein